MTMNTVGQHVKRFLRTKHNPDTRTWYAKYLRPMVAYFSEDRDLFIISRADAEDYWLAVQQTRTCWESHPSKPTEQRPLSPTTLHNHLRAARTFWNAMVRQQLVEYNPFDHLASPRDTRPVEMKAVTPDDLRAIWSAAKQSGKRDFAIVTVIATTGMRAGELVSMDMQRLDLKRGMAWVKGKRGWRKVFLGESSQAAIRDYLAERPENGPSALWLSVHKRPLTSDGVRQLVERLARKANVQGRYNLHAFRHRAAQAWLDKGINAEVVAQALGHADVNVTLSIYGNQDEKRVRSAMRQAELFPFDDAEDWDALDRMDLPDA